MTIIKRADLGRPLTWDELDDNFRQVDDLRAAASAAVSSASASATAAAGSATNSLNSANSASSSAADAAASAASAIDALMNSTFEPSSFDFSTGGTLDTTDRNKAVYNPADNNWYSWVGTLPHVVPPDTDPLSDVNWRPRTDQLLRQNLASSAIPGTSLVTHSDGTRLDNYIEIFNRRTKFIMPEDLPGTDTEQLQSALSYAKSNKVNVVLQAGKTYYVTGSQGLEVDLGYYSFESPNGIAYIDFTGCTAPYCLWVHSSRPYPAGSENHCTSMRGIKVKGAIQNIGQRLLLTGNNNDSSNGTYNGDCKIENCMFSTADIVLGGSNSTWRYKFINCGFMMESTGGTYAMHFPAGLSDSGESITFQNCKIFDMKGCPILVECASFAIGMPGTSVLNTPIKITGNGAMVILDSAANIENPGASAWYRYGEVTGIAARLILNGCTLVCNNPSLQTKPLFYVGENAFIDITLVKTPGNDYPFQNGEEGLRTFVEGDGYVTASHCIGDIRSGAGNIPLHKSLNPTLNPGFESGDLSSWTFNNTGVSTQTCVVGTEYKKTGVYGARMTSSGSSSCFLDQKVKVTQHGYYRTTCQVNTITAGTGTTAGALTVTFYDRAGKSIQSGASSSFTNTPSGWQSVGQFIQGRVPQSAEYCEVSIRCREGAVIDIDNFIINFT
ncbi:tail fiber [Klebsiella phage vB_KpnM_KpVB3]|nr:tail fiber [Klebsiella phage vB_KpnM_KpVB3]